MPWNRADYPADWEAIVRRIRDRAGSRCEWPGCGVRHLSFIQRWPDGECSRLSDGTPEELDGIAGGNDAGECFYAGSRMVKVVLTTAHTCKCVPLCGDDAHLLALCQLHHLRLDGSLHARHAAATRRRRQADRGQLFLIGDLDG